MLYHHFGCVVPTQAALSLIHQVAAAAPASPPTPPKKAGGSSASSPPRPVIEIGSGTGYWTFLLRKQFPDLAITPIDSGLSIYRTLWIADTIRADGPSYLTTNLNAGAGAVLLLVYPSVGDDFTGKTLRAFRGDAVVVAGTQSGNGFTGFKGETVSEWVARERLDWKEVARIPLPSFAGKDEALFVFVRKDLEGF